MRAFCFAVAAIALAACGEPAQGAGDVAIGGGASAAETASASGNAGLVAQGDYECWANGQARMLMNFTITAPGEYTASDGSTGTFDYDPSTGVITFTGYMRDIMLDTWVVNYHEQGGVPTVSYVSDRGAEAAFCENV